MTILNGPSNPPSRLPKWLPILFGSIALLGFFDGVYLAAEHWRGTVPPCYVVEGCERVLTSPYAAPFGIPLGLLGALYYGFLVFLVIAYLDTGHERILEAAARFSFLGLLASAGFMYLQIGVLEAICIWCTVSAFFCFVLFGIGTQMLRMLRASNARVAQSTP